MGGGVAPRIVDAGRGTQTVAPVTFLAVDRRMTPHIGDPVLEIPFVPEFAPIGGGRRPLAVEGEVGAVGRAAVLVGVARHPLQHFRRREIPMPVTGQIFAGGGVAHPACLIGQVERQAGSPPFVSQPLLRGQQTLTGRQFQFAGVEHAHLCYHRKPAQGSAIGVAGHMAQPFVPDDGLLINPSQFR